MLRNTTQTFGLINKLLHWLMAILLTGLFVVGLYMTDLDYYDPLYHQLPWWHKSLGLVIFALLVCRLIWKLINPMPAPLKSHQTWEILLAHWLQWLFYLLIFLIALSGYFIATAEGEGIGFFDWFEIPALIDSIDEDSADLIGDGHKIMAISLAVLVILHALAALKHHFIDKDETLKRMI